MKGGGELLTDRDDNDADIAPRRASLAEEDGFVGVGWLPDAGA
ncbi:hypothetical protein [Hoeflea sp.]